MDTGALKRLDTTIRRRRILAAMTALLLAVTLMLGVTLLLDARIYLPAELAVAGVEETDEGHIRIRMTDLVTGTCSLGLEEPEPENGTGNYGLIYWTKLQKLIHSEPRASYSAQPPEIQSAVRPEDWGTHGYELPGGAAGYDFWYCSPFTGKGETLLWDAGNPAPTGSFIDVNYHLAWYCLGLAAAAALLFLLGRKLPIPWAGELCIRFAVMALCISLSTVTVCAGRFMELYDEFTIAFRNGLVLAVPMTLTSLLARQLYRLNRQDRGMA